MASKKTIENSKLIKLLSTFSALEWKRFGRFVQSPYHNTNQQLIDLYTILKKAFPFEGLKALEQERIYQKIYSKEAFKLSKFQNLCSDLYELATDFIIDVHLDREKRKKKKLLIDALSERNYELFKGASQQLIKEVETQEYFLDEVDLLLLYQLNDGLYHHLEKDKYNNQKIELEKSWNYLNAFYKNTQIQFEAENNGSQNFLNQSINPTDLLNNQLTELFQEVINLHQQKETTLYFLLKEKVIVYWDKLKRQHKINLLVHLLNYSFTNELLQKEIGNKEALELYKIGIKDELFVINGKMRDIEFINICLLGFKWGNSDWTKNFISKSKNYLKEKDRQYLIPLVYAYEALFSKNYQQVFTLLRDIQPENNLIYYIRIKILIIRALFQGLLEKSDDYRELLNYELNSLKKIIIRNQKISTIQLEAYSNFIFHLRKLILLYYEKDNFKFISMSLEQSLEATSPLALKAWLKEKLKEIEIAAPKN